MNYQESREYIDKITREIPSVLGLEHMRELMKRLGNPQDDLKYVHVAGTYEKSFHSLRSDGLVHGNPLDRTAFHPFRRTYHEEKSDSINAAADKKRDSRKFTGERADDGTASVNGKH